MQKSTVRQMQSRVIFRQYLIIWNLQRRTRGGNIYNCQGRADDAERYLLRGRDQYEMLAEENPETGLPNLARALTNLATFYATQEDLAVTLTNLGTFYAGYERYEQAKECCLRALSIQQELFEANAEGYMQSLASTLERLGYLYAETDDPADAETYYLRALSLYEELVREDPETFSEKLAELLKMIVLFYAEHDDRENTMKYLGQLRALVQDSEE